MMMASIIQGSLSRPSMMPVEFALLPLTNNSSQTSLSSFMDDSENHIWTYQQIPEGVVSVSEEKRFWVQHITVSGENLHGLYVNIDKCVEELTNESDETFKVHLFCEWRNEGDFDDWSYGVDRTSTEGPQCFINTEGLIRWWHDIYVFWENFQDILGFDECWIWIEDDESYHYTGGEGSITGPMTPMSPIGIRVDRYGIHMYEDNRPGEKDSAEN